MPRNPSELARLEEEFEHASETAYNLNIGKGARESALREVRRLGKILGYNTKPYNGHAD